MDYAADKKLKGKFKVLWANILLMQSEYHIFLEFFYEHL